MKYRAEIDGMRTFAVMPVILFHLGIPGFSGGFLGVDVFFVLSGFLISRIVFDELEGGNFSFVKFWVRRVRRIVPAMLAMLVFVLIGLYPLFFSPGWNQVARHSLSAVASVANFAFLQDLGDYWGASAESSPLLHTWSLSVEEQFYFFFPAMAFFLRRKMPRIIAFMLLALVSLAAAFYAQTHMQTFGFYMLPTRAWELGIGVLASLLAKEYARLAAPTVQCILSALGLIGVVAACLFASSPGAWSLVAVLGCALVILDQTPGSLIARFLSWHPFVVIGKHSYSAYLWHWPIIVFAAAYGIRPRGELPMPILLALIALFSIASYRFVETPARHSKHLWRIVLPELALVVLLAGAYLILPSRIYDTKNFDPVAFSGYRYSVSASPLPASPEGDRIREGTRQPPPLPTGHPDLLSEGLTAGAKIDGYPDLVVLGDSHGCMWGELIDSVSVELGIKTKFFTSIGISPLFPLPVSAGTTAGPGFSPEQLKSFRENILGKIATWHPKLIVIAARWDNLQPFELSWFTPLAKTLMANGSRLLIFEQPPRIDIGNTNSAQFLSFANIGSASGADGLIRMPVGALTLEANESIRSQCAKLPGCEMLQTYRHYAEGERVHAVRGRTILYYDDDHLSTQGTRELSGSLRSALSRTKDMVRDSSLLSP